MASGSKKTVILFTRIPHAGKTKTRLMPFLTPDECVNLHYSFMADEIAEICKVADYLVVSYFEDASVTDDDREYFKSFLMEEVTIPFCTTSQRGADIFERMQNAFFDAFIDGSHGPTLLVGCDLPKLRAKDFKIAFTSLERNDVVLNPSLDGGYWLVGMRNYNPCVFSVKGDGGKNVLGDTLNVCGKNGLSVGVGRAMDDVDLPQDIMRLHTSREKLNENSLTRAFLENIDASRFELAGLCGMKVSVVVPVYNEESTIAEFIANLAEIPEQAEIVFVDGGSTDRTVEILEKVLPKNSLVIHSDKGRAHQMNEGAKVAKGDALMFLHADCIPPKNLVYEVRRILKETNWGCFGVKFDDKDPLMTICQIISNNRIHDRKVVFGDQGIFIKRELFEEIGGFPEIPIMEDYQLSLTLKDRGEKIGVAKGLITTSARRYHEGGKLSVMWRMNRLRKAYRNGVPIETISEQYRDIR